MESSIHHKRHDISKVLVVGGYGGVGKHVVEQLLIHFDFTVIFGGPNASKARSFKDSLLTRHPKVRVEAVKLDATDKHSLLTNFQLVDLAIITATVPEHISKIAEAALESNIDLIDILIRGDVVTRLSNYETRIRKASRVFITQSGFHPGILTPLIRSAKTYFDVYERAAVHMAMDGVFKQPNAIREIIYEIIEPKALILQQGTWTKATYKDAVFFDFGEHFGEHQCYPAQMKEIYGIEQELGLSSCAVYASGFDKYIDNFVFPLAVFLGFINKELSLRIASRLFFNQTKKNLHRKPKAKLVLDASGIKDGKVRKVIVSLSTNDSFQFTALVLVALMNQYLDQKVQPGLHLMGKVVDEKRLFEDLSKMGVELKMNQTR